MKSLLTVAVSIVLLSLLGTAQSNTSSTNVQDEIRKLEQRWLDAAAVPDLPVLRSMFANDFMGTAFGPKVLSKNDIIPRQGPVQNHLPKCSLTSSTVRVFGDTAVLIGDVQPEDANEEGYRVTTVFQKQGPSWEIIAIHMSAAQH